jgi:hypothetical protein
VSRIAASSSPDLTRTTAASTLPARGMRPAERVRAALRRLSDRAHARADADALATGWTITAIPGPLGLTGRAYRDPRFSTRGRP